MHRGQIIAPTGSGKTLLEHGAVNSSIKRGGLIHIILAPRIALVHQLLNEFWDYKETIWNGLCVCSSDAEYAEYYETESSDCSVETTTNPIIIGDRIKTALTEKIALNIFGTLHSASKIESALNANNIEADITIVDEAHNLTSIAWNWLTSLPSKRQLYFTATRRVSPRKDGTGRGMDNLNKFGEILFKITPKELIDSGRIVQPRMHLMYPTTEVDLSHIKTELRAKVMMVVAGALKHAEVMGDNPSRIIVFCTSADEAHDLAELQAAQIALPGWYMGAVTSKIQRMGRAKRKDIFRDFSKEKRSILFHYDVISEGIDLPGATAILPMRELGEIKIVQAIGRVLRVTKRDRLLFSQGKLVARNPDGWEKPYGWVLLPLLGGEYNSAAKQIGRMVESLREADFDIDVERMSIIEQAKPLTTEGSTDILLPQRDALDLFDGLNEALKRINQAVTHELETRQQMEKIIRPITADIEEGFLSRIKRKA